LLDSRFRGNDGKGVMNYGSINNEAKMDDLNSHAGGATDGVDDRRVQHNLRLIFENACRITAPFFDPAQSWGGAPLTMYARQALREAYPELSQQEIAILFSGMARFHKGAAKNSL
jgi:hypothetical protein